MILIGIGSNLAAAGYDSPLATAMAGAAALPAIGATLVALSPWYLSEPVPPSDQPWYANAVAAVATDLPPSVLLSRLLELEARFGRRRSVANAPRELDLDLLDYEGMQCDSPVLALPHPRLHQRRFVLAPLCDLVPGWGHPRLGLEACELLARLPPGQPLRRVKPASPAARPAAQPRVHK